MNTILNFDAGIPLLAASLSNIRTLEMEVSINDLTYHENI